MQPKVSVIVAVYNIREYLPQCIESLISQSYTALEILLVDDGSTDGSGAICDEWAERDPRVKVLHKTNGGQADARNEALAVACGEYIGFVDGDDFIDGNMYRYLVESALQFSAQIVMSAVVAQNEQGERSPLFKNDFQERQAIDKETAMRLLAWERQISTSPWNKLYDRRLFDSVRFPKGMVYEDKAVMHELFHRCETIAIDKRAVYYYRLRAGSTTNKAFSAKNFDQFTAAEMRYDFYCRHYPALAEEVMAHLCEEAMIQEIIAIKSGASRQDRRRVREWMRRGRAAFWRSGQLSWKEKLTAWTKYRLFRLAGRWCGKIKGR